MASGQAVTKREEDNIEAGPTGAVKRNEIGGETVEAVLLGERPAVRIVRRTRQDGDFMATLRELRDQIVDSEFLRPEVLGDDQEMQAPASAAFAPDDPVHVVGIAVKDAEHLVGDVGHAVVRDLA